MKKLLLTLIIILMMQVSLVPCFAQDEDAPAPDKVTIKVRNEFEEPIKIMLGESARLTYIEPGNTQIVGNRKPGKYDFSIYDKNGDYITKFKKEVELNKDGDAKTFVRANKFTAPDAAGKLDGSWSTGKKVAVGAGAVGAAALGTALIAKALGNNNADDAYSGGYPSADPYVPAAQQINATTTQVTGSTVGNTGQAVAVIPNTGNTLAGENLVQQVNNAFATGGSPIKFLNSKYDQITLIVEGTDGKPIGANWVIAKAAGFQTAKPLMYDGQKITIGQGQTVKVVVPGGYTLSRYAFELDKDPIDGSYSWVLR